MSFESRKLKRNYLKQQSKCNKSLLKELPYYSVNIILAHGQFNNLTDSCSLPSKKYLEKLRGLHDLDLFSLNTRNELDIDPNRNFVNTSPRSKYFSPSSFKNATSSYNTGSNNFSIAHINIRSQRKNFEDLQIQILHQLDIEFSIIALTETRICNSNHNDLILTLNGYRFEFVPTPLSAGGVGMYINNNLRYRIISRSSQVSFQALWIEILNPKSKNIICGVVYRQHNNPEVFLEYLSNTLDDISSNNKNIFLM